MRPPVDMPPPSRADAAREVTRIARTVVNRGDKGFTGELIGALLVSAGHAACALEMDAQEFCALASRYYAHAQRVRRRIS